MMKIRRRAFLGAAGALAACSPAATKKAPPGASDDWHDVSFPASRGIPDHRALVYAPPGSSKWPILIALHGRGEAGRGLRTGAYAWRDDYDLPRALATLRSGSMQAEDANDMLTDDRLASIRASVAKTPFEGLVVACPATPVPRGRGVADAAPFATFLTDVLLPKVGELRGAPPTVETTAIDGVSMGGRYALQIGLTATGAFGSVGALQPAIQAEEADELAELAARAMEKRPIHLRLVSSEDDPFLLAIRAFGGALDKRGIPHHLVVTRGPHDYAWNRGPGSIELLVHHERVMRGLPPP